MKPNPTIESLHQTYLDYSGMICVLHTARYFPWEAWLERGFTEADLKLVIRHIKNEINDHRRTMAALKFSNLIQDADRFEEDLSVARALARRPKPDYERTRVLQATGRTETVTTTNAVPIKDVLAGMKAFEAFKALKENL